MHLRTPLVAVVLTLGSFALPHAAHAAIPFFGPIIPLGITSVCAGGWGLLMLVINNVISFLVTIAIVFVAPLMIAWAGFLFVVNPVNAGGIAQAKTILTNTIVGIVIALAGWLIVDALMAVLYNAAASNGNGGVIGTWKDLLSTNGQTCLTQAASVSPNNTGTTVIATPGNVIGASSGTNITTAVSYLDSHALAASSGFCAQYVRQALAAGGLSAFGSPLSTEAKNYGPLLTGAGFTTIGSDNPSPRAGDVVVIQNYTGGSTAGHIAMYNGTRWVSDFAQTDFWGGPGYRTAQPAHTFYRP
jgi:hypothetical protein